MQREICDDGVVLPVNLRAERFNAPQPGSSQLANPFDVGSVERMIKSQHIQREREVERERSREVERGRERSRGREKCVRERMSMYVSHKNAHAHAHTHTSMHSLVYLLACARVVTHL